MAKIQPAPNSREENVPLLRSNEASSPGDAGAATEGGTPSGDVKPLSLEKPPQTTPKSDSEVAEQPKCTYDDYSRNPVFPEPLIGLPLREPSEMPRLGHVLFGYEVARKVSPAGYVIVVLLIIASLYWPEPQTRLLFFFLCLSVTHSFKGSQVLPAARVWTSWHHSAMVHQITCAGSFCS